MKFIFDLENKDLLPRLLDVSEKIEKLAAAMDGKDVRKPPMEGETANEAAQRNFKKLMAILCREHPAEVGKISDMLWALGEGEKAPNVLVTASRIVGRSDVLSFFTSLGSVGPEKSAN